MKPGTYTQNYVHIIFAVKNREAALNKNIRPAVFSYMSGIITALKHKSIIVNGMQDHVHVFLGLNPSVSISDTVHDLKRNTSLFINRENLCRGKFAWQEGYASFTYSRSQMERVYNYIKNQEKHHSKTAFKSEYKKFLDNYAIPYDERFLFDFWDPI
jgi:REP element-mobilizing transposase RayT